MRRVESIEVATSYLSLYRCVVLCVVYLRVQPYLLGVVTPCMDLTKNVVAWCRTVEDGHAFAVGLRPCIVLVTPCTDLTRNVLHGEEVTADEQVLRTLVSVMSIGPYMVDTRRRRHAKDIAKGV